MVNENGFIKVGIIAQDRRAVDRLQQDLRATNLATSVYETGRDISTNREELQLLKQANPEVLLIEATDPMATVATLQVLKVTLPDPWLLVLAEETDTQIIIESVRAGAREFLPHPVSVKNLVESLHRYQSEKRKQKQTSEGKLYCVTSPKGGAGATTVAINLATIQGTDPGAKVALIDLMSPLGDVATYLDLKPEYSFTDVLAAGSRLDLVLLKTYMTRINRVSVLPGFGDFSPDAEVDAEVVARTLEVAREGFTHTIVDLPSSSDESLLRLCSKMSDGLLIVLTPEVPSLWRTHRLLLFLAQICGPERFKVVLNRTHKRDRITPRDIEKTLGYPVFWNLPNDYRTTIESINSGKPLVSLNNTALASSYLGLKRKLAGVSTASSKKGLLGIFN